MSWLFTSGDQSIGVSASASVLPMNVQGLFPLGYVLCQFYLDKIGKKWAISPEEININSLSLSLAGCCSAGRHVVESFLDGSATATHQLRGIPGLFHRGGVNDCPWAMMPGFQKRISLLTISIPCLPWFCHSIWHQTNYSAFLNLRFHLHTMRTSAISMCYRYCKYFFFSFSLIHSLSFLVTDFIFH